MIPEDLAAVVAMSAAAFVATSLDNLLLLIGFQTAGTIPRRAIGGGYVVTIVLVCMVALGLATAAEQALPFSLGWLGLAPVTIGLWHGVTAFRTRPDDVPAGPVREVRPEDLTPAQRATGFLSVIFTMLANSSDSLIVVVALLGDTRSRLDWYVVGTMVAMATLWAVSARWLSTRPRLQAPMRGFARYGLPVLLVVIGVYILMDSPTDLTTP